MADEKTGNQGDPNPTKVRKTPTEQLQQFRKSLANGSIKNGAPAKTLEYLMRRTAARQAEAGGRQKLKAFENDTALGVEQSLESWGMSPETADRLAEGYRLPPFAAIVSQDAKVNGDQLADFAIVSRVSPVGAEHAQRPRKLDQITTQASSSGDRIVFGDIPGVSFAPERMLLACLTAQNDRILFYPHVDAKGKVVSTTMFEVSPLQRYVIERQAREALAKTGQLQKLTPQKATLSREYGIHMLDQEGSGKVVVKDSYNREQVYANGLLDYPINPYKTVDFVYDSSPNMFAAFNPGSGVFIVGEGFYKRRQETASPEAATTQEVLNIAARHEINHAIWQKLSDMERKQVMDVFTMSNENFSKFVDSFVDQGYGDAAKIDLVRNKTADAIIYKGEKLGKERIVNELLAYATWTEVVGIDTITKLRKTIGAGKVDDRAEQMMKRAAECVALLSEPVKDNLKNKRLRMEKNSEDITAMMNGFNVAVAMLKK